MATDDLHDLTQQYRTDLLALEQNTTSDLLYHYGLIWRDLQVRYEELQQLISEAGDQANISWLYKQQKYHDLLLQVLQQIQHLSNQIIPSVQQNIQIAIQMASHDALRLIQVASGAPNTDVFNRLPENVISAMSNRLQKPISKLFSPINDEAADRVKQVLLTAVTTGQHPRVTARFFEDATGLARWKSLRIARTETLNAYRTSSLQTYQANSNVVEGWIWSAASGSCALCANENGTEHTLDENLADLTHPNCRCAMQPRCKSWTDISPNLSFLDDMDAA